MRIQEYEEKVLTLSNIMKVETKRKIVNAMENPPDARKGTIQHVKSVLFLTPMPLLLFGFVSIVPILI